MWQRLSSAQRWGVVVAAGAVALALVNLWWVWRFRDGYPFNIDEAGYTTFGLVDYLGLREGGLHGWWDAIQGQSTFAPLVPALTSLTVYAHPGVLNGFAVLTGFLVVLVLAVYGISERLAGPRLGAFAAAVAATLPGVFGFAREYIFALPTAALMACAVFGLLRSDGLRSRRWAIATGAAIGLMLLTRTMAIAYVPGILLAALVALALRRDGDLPRRLLNLALLAVGAVAVAATWYARNLQSVIDYLTSFGYGSQSNAYGDQHSLLSWGRLRNVAEHMTLEDLFVPLAALLLLGLVATAVALARRLRRSQDRGPALRRLAAGDACSVAIVFAVGYAALTSSQNQGHGFTLPLAILLPPLAVLALRHFPRATVPAVAVTAALCLFTVLSTATIWADVSSERLVSIPGFKEDLPLVNGVPFAVSELRNQDPGPEATFDRRDAGWVEADNELLDRVAELGGPNGELPLVAFASRNRALNTNTVQLASFVSYHRALPLLQLTAEPDDSVKTYLDRLRASGASVLVSMGRNTDDFEPLVSPARVAKAARRLGFHKVDAMALPDGRTLFLWQREGA